MQQLSRILDAIVMKICYENSTKYQLSKRAIDVKRSTVTFNKKYSFVENMKYEV
jgi:hypothetical protein